ncbi:class I SAM-dependent methyltransferase [Amycolatopsis rubida]|uniref:Methyltransferase domain-containing protein n=1 Tax=Amycolatopsis rubida TaxID=112413 RepID=A0A1I5K873_9PSEU|nr:class I SAM-dependent methyltransferase [Amycolatopsis rubida]SFO81274.1 Methyltransferase domain-containing protein [Amycolatopsis rubida]
MSYWTTNVARHPGILRAVPRGCSTALDVGCGDGLLVRKLALVVPEVSGIDKSAEMVTQARSRSGDTFVEGDFLSADLGTYDFICSAAAIHHLDFEAALTRMRDMLRPGGALVVVGLARDASATDWAATIAAAPIVRTVKTVRRAHGPEGMPTVQPRMSYREVRTAARRLLPGVRYRRHVLRRYSLTWQKPS